MHAHRPVRRINGTAHDKPDDMLGIAGPLVAHPEMRAADNSGWIESRKPSDGVFGGIFLGERIVEFECACGVLGSCRRQMEGRRSG